MYAIILVLVIGLLLLAQWAFLRPGRAWTARLATKGRPLKSAVLAAAAMAMLLTVGFITLLLEIPDWWDGFWSDEGAWGSNAASDLGARQVGVYVTMFALWGLWAWVFFV